MSRALRFLVCCFIALALPLQGWAAHADCGRAQAEAQVQAAASMHEECAAHHMGKAADKQAHKMADKCGTGACCCHAVAMSSTDLQIETQPAAPVAVPTVPLAHASVPLAGIEKPPRAELA